MKQDIENIIDKKHNELFKIDFNLDYNTKLNLQRAILDSLADEVLKVIKEEYRKETMQNLHDIIWNEDGSLKSHDISYIVSSVMHYFMKDNLSPNKENKNNEDNL